MLHRVIPDAQRARFPSNKRLEVTPQYLRRLIEQLLVSGYEPISLDRLSQGFDDGQWPERFVCFTFDDGYQDTLDHALPIFEQYGIPFAVYIATGFIDGTTIPWHLFLESLLSDNNHILLPGDDGLKAKPIYLESMEDRLTVFGYLCQKITDMSIEKQRVFLEQLAAENHRTLAPYRELMLDWSGLKKLSAHSLVTIGAHTANHPMLSRLTSSSAVSKEMVEGKRRLEEYLNTTVEHFAYPFGTREAVGPREKKLARQCGFKTMATTREGTIHPRHCNHRESLPRIEVSGMPEDTIERLMIRLSGLHTMLYNRFNPVVTS